ncbi:hypothetical protein DUI87_11901 [Hirundo rustica rustica]|uniref:Endonuclease/exonuclease/phosphatase domain-containing protein n=1 Tax=Hirundo rustica rustica TaxID=333673 RepID=A0A3M0KF46_HIRRU|nr:hypothetical protein DUI87_11901 [Hirundo rustica rustica]
MKIETNDKVECLWVRNRKKANKAGIMVGVCYRPLSGEEEVDNLFDNQLEDISGSPALGLAGDFNLPDICWELNKHRREEAVQGVLRVCRGQFLVTASEQAYQGRDLTCCLQRWAGGRCGGWRPFRGMRELADELAKPFSIIYQQPWLTGEDPDDWNPVNVTPIHKKGWKDELGNYRPVSLTLVPGNGADHLE